MSLHEFIFLVLIGFTVAGMNAMSKNGFRFARLLPGKTPLDIKPLPIPEEYRRGLKEPPIIRKNEKGEKEWCPSYRYTIEDFHIVIRQAQWEAAAECMKIARHYSGDPRIERDVDKLFHDAPELGANDPS